MTTTADQSEYPPFSFYPISKLALHLGDANLTLTLKSLPDLPLSDLLDLSDGTSDETGHSIWRGSIIFKDWLRSDPISLCNFRGNILELGTGSGVSGLILAVLLSSTPSSPPSASLTLSDGDPATVDLAMENLRLNASLLDPNIFVTCSNLSWSEAAENTSPMDVVFATDVVYDLSILPPLLCTARKHLKTSGLFILSHIPRANIDHDSAVGSESELVSIITKAALSNNLKLQSNVPATLPHDSGSILVFAAI